MYSHMKRKTYTLFLLLTLCTSISAQDSLEYIKVLKFNPLNYLLGHANVGYEKVINNKKSIEYDVSIYYFDIFSLDTDEIYINSTMPGIGAALRYSHKYYLFKNSKAPLGYYLSPQAMIKFTDIKPFNTEYDYNYRTYRTANNHVVAVKFLFGYQKVMFNNFVLDQYIGIGGRYRMVAYNELEALTYDKQEKEWKDSTPKGKFVTHELLPSIHIGFTVGLAFNNQLK